MTSTARSLPPRNATKTKLRAEVDEKRRTQEGHRVVRSAGRNQVGMPTLARLAERLLAAGHKAVVSPTLEPDGSRSSPTSPSRSPNRTARGTVVIDFRRGNEQSVAVFFAVNGTQGTRRPSRPARPGDGRSFRPDVHHPGARRPELVNGRLGGGVSAPRASSRSRRRRGPRGGDAPSSVGEPASQKRRLAKCGARARYEIVARVLAAAACGRARRAGSR